MNLDGFNEWVKAIIFGYRKQLNPDDRISLEMFGSTLADQIAKVVQTQIEAISGVKHESKGKLTQLIYTDYHRSTLARVPNMEVDIFAASIVLENNRADILFSEGLLVAIEYCPAPFPDERRKAGKVLALCDLGMAAPPPNHGRGVAEIRSMLNGVHVNSIQPPVAESFQKNFAERLRCTLPSEFRDLLHITDGFETESFSFYGTRSRTIPMPEKTFHVLAEHNQLPILLCIEDAPGRSEVQFMNSEDETFETVAEGFIEGLGRLDQRF